MAKTEMLQKPTGKDWSKSVTAAVKKEGKSRELRVTVFPKEGGRPYVMDVEPDEQGIFTLDGGQDYEVVRGSVWEEAGKLRALVNEGNPHTISGYSLTGNDIMHPTALHGIAKNNLWVQLDTVAKRKSPWKQASTWGMFALGIALVGVMIWQVATVGGGLEELREAVEGLQRPSGGGGESAVSAPETEQSGRNRIAPGGG